MNSDVAAAGLDVALEIVLLGGGEHVAGGVEEDDCAVAANVLRGECARILGCVDGEPVLLSELSDRGNARSDGAVAEARGFGEDEYPGFLALYGGGSADREREKRERNESFHRRFRTMGYGERMAACQSATPATPGTEAPSTSVDVWECEPQTRIFAPSIGWATAYLARPQAK